MPPGFKTAKLLPITKPRKTPTSLSSFLPVALTCCVCKEMERMVFARPMRYHETNHCIAHEMIGILKHRSAINDTIRFVSGVQETNARGCTATAVFWDINAAFDAVRTDFINVALISLGLGGEGQNYIMSYLTDRQFCISTSEGDTAKHHLSTDVPQGGVLSPILFSIRLLNLKRYLPEVWKYPSMPMIFELQLDTEKWPRFVSKRPCMLSHLF